MASLWSLWKDRRRSLFYDPDSPTAAEAVRARIRSIDECKDEIFLVNAQDVWARVDGHRINELFDCEDLTPGHSMMWFEWLVQDGLHTVRQAVLVHRDGIPPDVNVELDFFFDKDGTVCWLGGLLMPLDDDGKAKPMSEWKQAAGVNREAVMGCTEALAVVCEALVTMNTEGTIVSATGGPKRNKHHKVGFSIWHTIELPKPIYNTAGGPGAESTEAMERRDHPVRFVRADYRKNGLFGKYHMLVWKPDYRRGNPDLGTVKRSYKVS
jgi:hypothetical protein